MSEKNRCSWCGEDPLYVKYHDEVWGVPVYDDRLLFEMLCLEGAQAGLSWITILRKRENYVKAFNGFYAEEIALWGDKEVDELVQNEGIVRNRLKIQSVIKNAKGVLKIQENGTLSDFLWKYVDGKPIVNKWKTLKELPANTEISDKMSKDLKKLGFNFVGSTICYAFMQATGMVNDHLVDCFRYQEV